MDTIIVAVILSISVILLIGISVIFLKLFGKGIFCGLKMSCVVVAEEEDDIEEMLYHITVNLRSDCEYSGVKIIIIDCGMNEEQKKICEKYCRKYGIFIISDSERIGEDIICIQKKR